MSCPSGNFSSSLKLGNDSKWMGNRFQASAKCSHWFHEVSWGWEGAGGVNITRRCLCFYLWVSFSFSKPSIRYCRPVSLNKLWKSSEIRYVYYVYQRSLRAKQFWNNVLHVWCALKNKNENKLTVLNANNWFIANVVKTNFYFLEGHIGHITFHSYWCLLLWIRGGKNIWKYLRSLNF